MAALFPCSHEFFCVVAGVSSCHLRRGEDAVRRKPLTARENLSYSKTYIGIPFVMYKCFVIGRGNINVRHKK